MGKMRVRFLAAARGVLVDVEEVGSTNRGTANSGEGAIELLA
jgi:hypothetical protein